MAGPVTIDEEAAAAVLRIFDEFLAGRGLYAIAEGLTRESIACPSAHDPGRNQHRCGVAWSKGAVRAILTNPRYTGRQVWNRQRKDEVLIDVTDVALGHVTKMRWNPQDKWIYSEQITHPPIISEQRFQQAQQILAGRGTGPKRAHPAPHTTALHPARAAAVRRLRPADDRQLEQRPPLLPLPFPRRIRPRQQDQPPQGRLPARSRHHRPARRLADHRVRPRPPRRHHHRTRHPQRARHQHPGRRGTCPHHRGRHQDRPIQDRARRRWRRRCHQPVDHPGLRPARRRPSRTARRQRTAPDEPRGDR